MCDGMREPPRPGTELYCYWREESDPLPGDLRDPVPGEDRDLKIGDWPLRVRVLKVKDSRYFPDRKQVTMKVIG